MKFVVPLTIPWMRSTCAAARVSCSTRMTGTTPATAPSKRSWTPCSRAVAQSSSPCEASSSLLAETTCLPARMAVRTYSRAGSRPPISSTTRSEPARTSSKLPRERVSTPESSGRRPVMFATASARSSSSRAKAAPTVPWPSRPTLYVSAMKVLEGLPAHDQPRAAVFTEHDGRAGHAVVVVGHRVHVGAGDRGDEHVARPRLVQARLADEHVAGLAVLADHGARRARRADAVGQIGLVVRVVAHRAQVVGHPAVDADEAHRAVGQVDVLDRLDGVQRHTGGGDERAARLDAQLLARAQDLVGGGDHRAHVLGDARGPPLGRIGHGKPAAEVVGLEVAELGDRLAGGPPRGG